MLVTDGEFGGNLFRIIVSTFPNPENLPIARLATCQKQDDIYIGANFKNAIHLEVFLLIRSNADWEYKTYIEVHFTMFEQRKNLCVLF